MSRYLNFLFSAKTGKGAPPERIITSFPKCSRKVNLMIGFFYKVYDVFALRPTSRIREFGLRFPDKQYDPTPLDDRKLKPRQIFVDNTMITSKYNIITFIPRLLLLLL